MADRRLLGLVRPWEWVVAQAALLVALVVVGGGPALGPSAPREVLGLVVGAAGAAWAVAAAPALGGALTPSPVPNGAGLATRGVYRWVRHPMYLGVLVAYLGLVIWSATLWRALLWAALCGFYAGKARVEDQHLLEEYPGYRGYAREVGRLVPGVGRLP